MIKEIKTKAQLVAFNEALQRANKAAQRYADTEDGGTCNFDTCVINLKIYKKFRDLTEYPLRKTYGGRVWQGWWFVDITLCGQGNRRTCMAEAAATSLKADGYDASVWYGAD